MAHTEDELNVIRRKILKFAKDEGRNGVKLGVKRLIQHVADANGIHPVEVPPSTFQRFMRGDSSNAWVVTLCAKFAEPLPDEEDRIGDLGKAMSRFYDSTGDDYSGFFFADYNDPSPPLPDGPCMMHADIVHGDRVSSTLNISRHPLQPCWMVEENLVRLGDHTQQVETTKHLYEGPLVSTAEGAVCVLKNRLNDAVKTMIFWPSSTDENALTGQAIAATGDLSVPVRGYSLNMRMLKVREG